MRVGVLLAGCGLYDGSDPSETFLLLLALEEAGERPLLVSPDRSQARVVDHLTSSAEEGAERNMLRESARLSRHPVRSLAEVSAESLEALFIPGGYGAAINFQDGFAVPGASRPLHPEAERFLRHFFEARKPVGTIGLGEVPVRALLGLDLPDASPAPPARVDADPDRRLWHTAGSASGGRLADMRQGIASLVQAVLEALHEPAPVRAAEAQP